MLAIVLISDAQNVYPQILAAARAPVPQPTTAPSELGGIMGIPVRV